jgi:hypothetical protein
VQQQQQPCAHMQQQSITALPPQQGFR